MMEKVVMMDGAHIGIAFKIIAEKAQAYEDMTEGNWGDIHKN